MPWEGGWPAGVWDLSFGEFPGPGSMCVQRAVLGSSSRFLDREQNVLTSYRADHVSYGVQADVALDVHILMVAECEKHYGRL